MRGGRMFELQFRCTYDLLSSIPSLVDPSKSVTEDDVVFCGPARSCGSTCSPTA
ncbi:MAG: oleate hydratase [Streptomyces oryziradicis]|nr:oleate hydratase [Actinacidiphila oryziradicis]MCW2889246.1 oleate hydratase [Streptosporangiaceae bacterium]